MKLSELKNKNIAIWGFGVEGKATAEYLARNNIKFSVICKTEEIDNAIEGIRTHLNNWIHSPLLNNFDVVIKSPGISPYTDLVKNTIAQFTSPTAIWFANEKKTSVIAVTGTKGKSTTVSLLTHILKSYGKSVNLVGNIGQALISSSSNYDYIVLEASSFQIQDGGIQADIALINNIFPEHIDWHNGEKNYFKDKLRILKNAKIKIINAENVNLTQMVQDKDVSYFNIKLGFHVENDQLLYKSKVVLNLSDINLIGTHNLQNIGAALSICTSLDLDIGKCIKAIKTFKPLAHRLQNLGRIGKHFAINDSIATTPIATIAAMQTQDLNKTTLLVGGYNRGNDWTEFAQLLNDNPPQLLILSGENAHEILQHFKTIKTHCNFVYCDTLKQAIKLAQSQTPENHTILLSPGAPSFDQFESYIKRGEFFAEELKKNAI
jgi:UDP-N-acetylmuramoylalanine--D-glutamate ligase